MLTCRELTELVTEYLEGRQSLMDRLRFELHLGMCRHCRAYLHQVRATIRTLGVLPPVDLPDAMRDELLARFRTWRGRSHTGT